MLIPLYLGIGVAIVLFMRAINPGPPKVYLILLWPLVFVATFVLLFLITLLGCVMTMNLTVVIGSVIVSAACLFFGYLTGSVLLRLCDAQARAHARRGVMNYAEIYYRSSN